MGIITDDFMLYNNTGKYLYETYAKDLPIIDYHCHLSPEAIAEDRTFQDAHELFLGTDHYKWRQMRSCGVPEHLITGTVDKYEAWCAFAKCMPLLIGNPLYHWTALELKRYFDIDTPLNGDSAKEIWDSCNKKLAEADFSPKRLIERSKVVVLCTTDDPADNLEHHKKIKDDGFKTKVLPTFRPDKAVEIEKPTFLPYMKQIGISDYPTLIQWFKDRIAFFNAAGCRLADHGLEGVPYEEGNGAPVFEKRMRGEELTVREMELFKTALLQVCAEEYTKYGWTMQLHMGALRNNNTKMFRRLGADSGFDSIQDLFLAKKLSALLDSLETRNILPKTILYTLNPKDNYVLGTMVGNFQSSPVPGKIQFGSAWWFNDNRDGMEAQMKALANLGALGTFVGMLTDSRSFVSYPRHEYFRRILCNMVGEWVERGEYPHDEASLKRIIEGICYGNAKQYFEF